jgi:hypothetical protein
MSVGPDSLPHQTYSVTFRAIDGSQKERRVITSRGEAKAVYLATRAEGRLDALDVTVTNDRPPQVDAQGTVILKGLGFDRNEW